jgi:hypothetical protein
MAKKIKSWLKSKTVWAGIVGIVTGFGMYFTGEQSLQELAISVISFIFMILRAVTTEPIK